MSGTKKTITHPAQCEQCYYSRGWHYCRKHRREMNR